MLLCKRAEEDTASCGRMLIRENILSIYSSGLSNSQCPKEASLQKFCLDPRRN